MTLADKLLQDFKELPDEKKRQVIDFVEFLRAKQQQELEQMMDSVIAENKEAFLELAK
ncbi:DUF2281 domain-containing protein [Sporomusa malonica]|uniref:DUF2281 domain-containing protein n=1 Tax=Sporomusa malonica TaxID=112901 RepID=A0A1W2CST3_9FIRM|nr:DUF2281 domain-containing protein [Sporomusa malonica]SMC88305.1 Protein of unknown function [Sporomusa malonica]